MNSRGFDSKAGGRFYAAAASNACVQNIFTELSGRCGGAEYAVCMWPKIRKMTQKSLHDHHIARLAWRARRSWITTDPAMSMFGL
jgi:hypothetical protein